MIVILLYFINYNQPASNQSINIKYLTNHWLDETQTLVLTRVFIAVHYIQNYSDTLFKKIINHCQSSKQTTKLTTYQTSDWTERRHVLGVKSRIRYRMCTHCKGSFLRLFRISQILINRFTSLTKEKASRLCNRNGHILSRVITLS